MRLVRHARALPLLLLLSACGGGGSPSGPSTPPPATQTHPLGVVVFYDENGNGVLDPGENVRLPNVSVVSAGQSAGTGSGGSAVLNLPAGQQTVQVAPETLPPFWESRQVVADIPRTSQVVLPATLPIGGNQPNTYMGFGDSITVGEGSSDGLGYRRILQDALTAYLGKASVINEGVSATRSNRGAARIQDSLASRRPAYTLIHYGTNDWNEAACRNEFPCYTLDSLRTIVRECKAARSLPFLATIIPTNTGYDARVPPQRNEWVGMMDTQIRQLAAQEGAVLVDLEKAYYAAAGNNLASFFDDHIHPNDRGYSVLADTFFASITRPRSTSSLSFGDLAATMPGVFPPASALDLAPPGPALPHERPASPPSPPAADDPVPRS